MLTNNNTKLTLESYETCLQQILCQCCQCEEWSWIYTCSEAWIDLRLPMQVSHQNSLRHIENLIVLTIMKYFYVHLRRGKLVSDILGSPRISKMEFLSWRVKLIGLLGVQKKTTCFCSVACILLGTWCCKCNFQILRKKPFNMSHFPPM